MYTTVNFKSKKALKEAIASGQRIGVYQPNQMFPVETENTTYSVEGPHYPEPHKWYARVVVKDGAIVKVT